MSETTNIPPIVLGAVIMCSCGALCGAAVGVRIGALNDAAWFLILLAVLILVTLPAFMTGIVGGGIWAVLHRIIR
jgi:hypothetical protein